MRRRRVVFHSCSSLSSAVSGLNLNLHLSIPMDGQNKFSGQLSVLIQCATSLSDKSLVSLYSFAARKSSTMDVEPPAVNHFKIGTRFKNAVGTDHATAQALLPMYTRSFAWFQSHLKMPKCKKNGILSRHKPPVFFVENSC